MTLAHGRYSLGGSPEQSIQQHSSDFRCYSLEQARIHCQLLKHYNLDSLEWVFGPCIKQSDPLLNARGRTDIRALINEFDISVASVRASCLTISHHHITGRGRTDFQKILTDLIGQARAIGANTIIVPLADASHQSLTEVSSFLSGLLEMPLAVARSVDVTVSIEADLPARDFVTFAETINHESFGICYNVALAMKNQWPIKEDIQSLGQHLAAIRFGPSTSYWGGHSGDVSQLSSSHFSETLDEIGYKKTVYFPLEEASTSTKDLPAELNLRRLIEKLRGKTHGDS